MFKSMTDATLDQYIRNQEQEIRWRHVDLNRAIAERTERRLKRTEAIQNYTDMTTRVLKNRRVPNREDFNPYED